MAFRNNSNGARIAVWVVFLIGLLIAGCQFIIPRQEWSSKKWGPLVPHTNFPGDCSICHLPDRWDKLRDDFAFDHEKETGYPLQGAHAQAACLRCHNDRGPVEAYVARGCAGCHVDPHASTMGLDCTRCHSEMSWQPQGLVGEHARTRFPLVGAHAVTACESCHDGAATGDFRGAPLQCEACHIDDATQVASPDHRANGWVTGCQRCHNGMTWGGANIVHDFFPLTGGHSGLNCVQCHTTPGAFNGLSQDCYACHATDFQGAPSHVELNFSHDCTGCHSKNSWTPATFDHSFFPLTGGHASLDCAQCHTEGTFAGLSQDCFSCHQPDYQGAPDHVAQSFPQNCEQCHATTSWTPASFNHSAFPLTGGHAGVSCAQCHSSGTFAGLASDCYSCHESNYQGAPDHVSLNFSHNCEQCHSSTSWTPAAFDHSFFPLTAGHSGVSCTECHVGGTYTGLSQDCYACHDTDFQGAPSHVDLKFSHDCEQCHTKSSWTPATFDHSFFPLTQGHTGLDCAQCHAGGTYTGLSQDCYACHTTDFQGAPSHVDLNFSHDCEQCHTRSSWAGATFSHTFFPLTDGHSGLTCTQCHAGGGYTGLSTDCYSCHATDFQGAPDHAALGFPHDCTQCHSIKAWSTSSFAHDFPLRGDHNVSCVTCHDSGSTSEFNCLGCHEHNKTSMDSKHRERSGYSYTSSACYKCHPDGRD